jgi:hypothetical protein
MLLQLQLALLLRLQAVRARVLLLLLLLQGKRPSKAAATAWEHLLQLPLDDAGIGACWYILLAAVCFAAHSAGCVAPEASAVLLFLGRCCGICVIYAM